MILKNTLLYFLFFICVALAEPPSSPAEKGDTPNVLFIICDDLNDWVLKPEGHPDVISPNMDRLRAKGVNFSNAHVVTPVCGPSRKILFSGLYPQTYKAKGYGFMPWGKGDILKDCVPIPLHFRNNGYNTFGAGKLLHHGAGGDFYKEFRANVCYGPMTPPRTKEGKKEDGWVHPKLYARWGDSVDYFDFGYAPLSEVPLWEGIPDEDNGWRQGERPFRYVTETDRDLMSDEKSARYAEEILQQEHDRPFYLSVGFIRPHTPLFAPKKYFDLYPLDSITLPPTMEGDLDDCAEALKGRNQHGFEVFKMTKKVGAWKEWVQAYLACISFVDDQLGIVLEALEESSYAENTIIIFTSDHGFHIGEKQSMHKWHLWEESTRVPFFIYDPRGKGNGKTCSHPVSVIDLYPTLNDLCGLPSHPNAGKSDLPLEGHTLRPFLENPATSEWSGSSVAFMEISHTPTDKEGLSPSIHHSVRSRHFRYTLCQNGEEELYDHKNDPNEWKNLAHDPAYLSKKEELKKALMAKLPGSP